MQINLFIVAILLSVIILYFIACIISDNVYKPDNFYYKDIIKKQYINIILKEYRENSNVILSLKSGDIQVNEAVIEDFIKTDLIAKIDFKKNYESKGTIYSRAYIISYWYGTNPELQEKYGMEKVFLIK